MLFRSDFCFPVTIPGLKDLKGKVKDSDELTAEIDQLQKANKEAKEKYVNDEGEEKCRTMSKEYTLSLHEKSALTKVLEAWRGAKFTEEELAGFDLNKILGKPCQIQVIHTVKGDNTYSNIAAIMALPKGMKVDAPTETLVYDLDDAKAVENIVLLPEWIQKKVMESETWKEKTKNTVNASQGNHNTAPDDDFPF